MTLSATVVRGSASEIPPTGSSDEALMRTHLFVALLLSLLIHILVFLQLAAIPPESVAHGGGALQVRLSAGNEVLSKQPQRLDSDAKDEVAIPFQSVVAKAPALEPRVLTERKSRAKAKYLDEVAPNVAPVPSRFDQPNHAKESQPSPGVNLSGRSGAFRRVDIEFQLFSGADRKPMGSGRHVFVSDGEGHYGVSVRQRAEQPEENAIEAWQLEISGSITPHGLSPNLFDMNGLVPAKLMALKRGVENGADSDAPRSIKGRMRDGLLDRQSLLYHFTLQPPHPGGGRLFLTDGKVHGAYTYKIDGGESLKLPSLGEINTIKLIVRADEGADLIELWLVPTLNYLPARVRYTDQRGAIVEQLATGIDFR
jgi:hypothetical protein